MPVDTEHKQYKKNFEQWKEIRDFVAGEPEVKNAENRERYLPRLPGMEAGGQYDDYGPYLQRALFYGAASRTVAGLTGAVFRRPVQATVPKGDKPKNIVEQVTPSGQSLQNFARYAVEEVIQTSRFGVRVDYPEEGADIKEPRAYLCGYDAESVINWRTGLRNGRLVPTLVVLKHCEERPDAADEFEVNDVPVYEVLTLNSSNEYTSQKFEESKDKDGKKIFIKLGEPVIPKIKGKPLDYIPFVMIGANGLSWDIQKSPIADLVGVNAKHYLQSGDYAHGLFFTALPTPWVSGYDDDDELRIGSGVAWTFRKTDTQVGMLEFTGQGLAALKQALDSKESMMALLGAAILAPQKREAETAEALKIRNAGESSVLSMIAGSVGEGLTIALKWLFDWERLESKDVSVKLNQDYFESRMSPEELTAYMSAWQQGVLTSEAFAFLLVNGELLPPGTKPEEYAEQLEEASPKMMRGGSPLDLNEPIDPNNPEPEDPNDPNKKPTDNKSQYKPVPKQNTPPQPTKKAA